MRIKSHIVKIVASFTQKKIRKWSSDAIASQWQIRDNLIKQARHTVFGKDHHFDKIKTYEDFKRYIPLVDYEGMRPYIRRIIDGERDILWRSVPRYFAKTSGTTSGVKYIPITNDSMSNHIVTARDALFNYVGETGNARPFDGKMIFLSGSPTLKKTGDILTGRLSGIVNHEVPRWLRSNQLPTYTTNCIEEWEQKLDKIVEETVNQDMRLISGIPPWVKMYYERLLEKSGKEYIKDVFPNLSLFVYGGVDYEPYKAQLESLVGNPIDSIETYPASEGFIAFQDRQDTDGLLLNTHSGIFFEFVPANEIFDENPTRLMLEEVELGVNYAIILNSNAGLWGYNIGDTVRFVSLSPYRIVVTGRIKHFISAFGEHVIGKEVENALSSALKKHGGMVTEFTVAPQVHPPEGGLPYHQWFVEFAKKPEDPAALEKEIDKNLCEQNIYYKDLIIGKILRPLKISVLPAGTFVTYMKSIGKLGGQNKVPRLANDRTIARELEALMMK